MTESGLTAAEAARRLAIDGANEPVVVRRRTLVAQVLRLFANPLVVILLVASVVSASLGQVADAVIIATIIGVSITLDFWQSYRSHRAAEALRSMVAPRATVSRDGAWVDIPMREVVPGDLVRLSAGDLVPADGRLLDVRDLSMQESALTGESLPADKAIGDPAFLGASVISGTATMAVLQTGAHTRFGDIAARLTGRPAETEFEHGLRRFSVLILTTTTLLVLFILMMSIAFRRDPFESLLFAVALGVGLTPEFLPMITTVTLAKGALRMADRQVIVKRLQAIQNLGSIDILCSDKTGTLTAGVMQLDRSLDPAGHESPRALTLARINSVFETGIRSPFDGAILAHATADTAGYQKIDEIPFDFQRRRLSVVVDLDGGRTIITKGAPESMLPVCTAMEIDGREVALDEHARTDCRAVCDRLAADGYRVLAVASRVVEARDSYSRADETQLVLAGFISFADPVLPDAAETLAELRADGVTVKILTGDNDTITRHVCRQVDVAETEVVTGDELDRLDDAALGHVAEQASVFTRVSPAQKNRIIVALKRRGHVVGFLGDGINDAPSLHTADVGISVMSAVDVARESADIILAEPSLRVLHGGILEGRRASGNLMKYLLMGTSSNFGNMFSMAIASLFLPFLPMLPTQILLNNFLYDLAQITIPTDNVDEAYVRRPQRWDIAVVRRFMIVIGPISSIFDILTFVALLRIFHADETLFHTGWFVESLATQTLVLFVIRTMDNPLRSRPSRALTLTTLSIVVIGLLLPVTPLAGVLGFTAPPLRYFALLVLVVVTYLALVESVKRKLVAHYAA
jgi:Mg2+-importing ATPase